MRSKPQDDLLELASRVSAEYRILPNLDAILLTGSVAKGITDEVSDIDLMLYYRKLPTAEQFEQLKQAALESGGGIYSFTAEEGLACYYFIDGVKVDFAHQATTDIEKLVSEFLAKPTVDNETTHIIMSGIVQGIVLWGEETIVRWQERLNCLPIAYSTELIQTNLRFPPRAVLFDMGVKRRDYAFVYELLLESTRRLLNVWCGLSGTIPPGKIKSSDRVAAQLAVVPQQVGARLCRMWSAPPEQAVALFYELVDETLTLVEQLHPEIDASHARDRLTLPLHKRTLAVSETSRLSIYS